jgi:protoporphyrinogen oxidase
MDIGSKKRIAVIGAGPAGLAAALKLAQAGVEVDLYESQSEVGGLCRSLELWGHKVDLGPHRFFSQSEKVNRFWFDIVGTQFSWVRRQTRIFYKKKYFNYPLQPISTLKNLGWVESALCLGSYLREKLKFSKPKDHNFEGWITSRFGQRLYKIFFKTYSEKLWGLPCSEIDSDFAYRKIRRLSIFEIIKKFSSYKKTHLEYFAYPKEGTGALYNKMADRFLQNGGQLFLSTRIQEVRLVEGKVRVSSRNKVQNYDNVISTMPLNYLVKALGAPENVLKVAKELKFRNTVLVYLLLEGRKYFKDNWIYVHSPGVDFGRVTNFNNWSPDLNGDKNTTVLCLEYWCDDQEALWISQDGALIENATAGLEESGILVNSKVLAGAVYRVPKSYPIFKLDYKANLSILNEYLQQFTSVCSIGRNGSFSYNNQDHSILMGIEAAENIIRGLPHRTMSLTSTYEEDGEIVRFAAVEEV